MFIFDKGNRTEQIQSLESAVGRMVDELADMVEAAVQSGTSEQQALKNVAGAVGLNAEQLKKVILLRQGEQRWGT